MSVCYILQSIKSGAYYVGSSENFGNRLKLHNLGAVKSTKSDVPWKVVFVQNFQSFLDARKRESEIKRWKSRKAIERLIKTFEI